MKRKAETTPPKEKPLTKVQRAEAKKAYISSREERLGLITEIRQVIFDAGAAKGLCKADCTTLINNGFLLANSKRQFKIGREEKMYLKYEGREPCHLTPSIVKILTNLVDTIHYGENFKKTHKLSTKIEELAEKHNEALERENASKKASRATR